MSRTDLNISRVQLRLKDKGEHQIQRDTIISEMSQVQMNLCKDYLAYKVELILTLVATQTQYIQDATIFKIKKFIKPSSWKHEVMPIYDPDNWANIIRMTGLSPLQPLYGFTWNKIINLFPAPAVTGETLNVLAYAYPAADLVFGGDPEISQEWDDALMLGTLNNLLGGDYKTLYEEEASGTSFQMMKEDLSGPLIRKHWSDGLGY